MEGWNSQKTLLLLVPFVAVAAGAFWLGQNRPQFIQDLFPPENLPGVPAEEIASFRKDTLPHLAAKRLSTEQYKLRQEKLKALVGEKDPNLAFDELSSWIRNGEVRHECNNFTYDIGFAAYEKYGALDQTLSYQRYFCGSGYFHGVLGALFAKADDSAEVMEKTCDAFPKEQERGECYHQLGHSTEHASDNDLAAALARCDALSTDAIRRWCGLGVFHQHFAPHEGPKHSMDIIHIDPRELCSKQDPLYKANCYTLAPRAYLRMEEESAASVLDWCAQIPEPYDLICLRGATWDIMQYTYDLGDVEKFCVSEGSERVLAACIDQMVAMLLATHTKDEMRGFCTTKLQYLPARERCLKAVETENKWES